MSNTKVTRILVREGTTQEWSNADTMASLNRGEIGFETDKNRIKVSDDNDKLWEDIEYIAGGVASIVGVDEFDNGLSLDSVGNLSLDLTGVYDSVDSITDLYDSVDDLYDSVDVLIDSVENLDLSSNVQVLDDLDDVEIGSALLPFGNTQVDGIASGYWGKAGCPVARPGDFCKQGSNYFKLHPVTAGLDQFGHHLGKLDHGGSIVLFVKGNANPLRYEVASCNPTTDQFVTYFTLVVNTSGNNPLPSSFEGVYLIIETYDGNGDTEAPIAWPEYNDSPPSNDTPDPNDPQDPIVEDSGIYLGYSPLSKMWVPMTVDTIDVGQSDSIDDLYDSVNDLYDSVEDIYDSVRDIYDSVNDLHDSVTRNNDSIADLYDSVNDQLDSINDLYDSVDDLYDSVDNKVDKTGDTMTGNLDLSGVGITNSDSMSLYFDSINATVSTKQHLIGDSPATYNDTVTFVSQVHTTATYEPTDDDDIVDKKYLDLVLADVNYEAYYDSVDVVDGGFLYDDPATNRHVYNPSIPIKQISIDVQDSIGNGNFADVEEAFNKFLELITDVATSNPNPTQDELYTKLTTRTLNTNLGKTITLPCTSASFVDWGDGTQNSDITHTYSSDGPFNIEAIFDWDNSTNANTSGGRPLPINPNHINTLFWLDDVTQFGMKNYTRRRNQTFSRPMLRTGIAAFAGFAGTSITALDTLDASNLSSIYRMFFETPLFNQNLNDFFSQFAISSAFGAFQEALSFNNGGVAVNWDINIGGTLAIHQEPTFCRDMFRGCLGLEWDVIQNITGYGTGEGAFDMRRCADEIEPNGTRNCAIDRMFGRTPQVDDTLSFDKWRFTVGIVDKALFDSVQDRFNTNILDNNVYNNTNWHPKFNTIP